MLIANLPYAAATPLVVTLLVHHPLCRRLAVTIQREVADRLLAQPGDEAFGSLSVVAQATARIRRAADLGPECFWPRPKVESSMVILDPLAPTERASTDPADLLEFAKSLFSRRRKQIGSALPKGVALPAGITARQRPESLTIPQFEALRAAVRGNDGVREGARE